MSGKARLRGTQLTSWGGVGGSWVWQGTASHQGLCSSGWAPGTHHSAHPLPSWLTKRWRLSVLTTLGSAAHVLSLPRKVLRNSSKAGSSREAHRFHCLREDITEGCASLGQHRPVEARLPRLVFKCLVLDVTVWCNIPGGKVRSLARIPQAP